ncbi:helicase associated domain-containing protein, partial [Streptomyces inhibens]|uniref:helicase associated domain-containing protein n=1 Tax=Streptomyces inhibens TaxID=2293571 RepID=UPI00402AD7A5
DLVDADGVLPYIAPGVVFEGDDLGTWRWRQQEPGTWAQLSEEQQERLTALGVQAPSPAPATTSAAKGPGKAQQAFQRGLAALAQYKAREGHVKVSRAHAESVVIDDQEHTVKLGVFLSNTKSRRGKLTADQRTALAELGFEWAR